MENDKDKIIKKLEEDKQAMFSLIEELDYSFDMYIKDMDDKINCFGKGQILKMSKGLIQDWRDGKFDNYSRSKNQEKYIDEHPEEFCVQCRGEITPPTSQYIEAFEASGRTICGMCLATNDLDNY